MPSMGDLTVRMIGDASNYNRMLREAARQTELSMRDMVRHTTQAAAAITTAMAGVSVASVAASTSFELSMSRIEGLTDTSKKEVQQFHAEVLKLSVTLGLSPTELSNALYFLISSGIDASKAMSVLEQTAKSSISGLGAVKDIATTLATSLNAYTKSGLTAAEATETILAGIKYGTFEADQFAKSLGRVVGIASSAKVSFQDLVGTASVLSLVQKDAAAVMTEIQAVILSIIAPSAEARKAMEEAGLSVEELKQRISQPGGLVSAMRSMEVALRNNADGMNAALPNLRAFRGASNLLAQDQAKVDEIMRNVANSVGSLDKAFEVTSKTLSFKFGVILSQLKVTLIDIGTVLGTYLAPYLDSFSRGFAQTWEAIKLGAPPVIESIRGVFSNIKSFIVEHSRTIAIITASVIAAYTAYKIFNLTLGVTALVLTTLKVPQIASAALWVTWTTAVVAAKTASLVFTVATTALNAALSATNLLMAGSFLVSAVAAAGALTAGFGLAAAAVWGAYQAAKSVAEAVASIPTQFGPIAAIGGVFSEWGSIFQDIIRAAKTDMPLAFEILTQGAKLAILQVKALFPPTWAFIKEGFSALWDLTTNNFVLAFQNAIASIIQETLRLVNIFSDLPGNPFGPIIASATQALADYREEGQALARNNIEKAKGRLAAAAAGFDVNLDTDDIKEARKQLDKLRGDVGVAEEAAWWEKTLGPMPAAGAAAGKKLGAALGEGIAGGVKKGVDKSLGELARLDAVRWGSVDAIKAIERQRDMLAPVPADVPGVPAAPAVGAMPAPPIPVVKFNLPGGDGERGGIGALAQLLQRIAASNDGILAKGGVNVDVVDMA